MRYFVIHQPQGGGQDEYEVSDLQAAEQEVARHRENGDYADWEDRWDNLDEMYAAIEADS